MSKPWQATFVQHLPFFILAVAATVLLCIFVIATASCRMTSSSRSAATSQAAADADREEELQYQDEQGNTDWQGRMEAAKESLEQAQSASRWGNEVAALEHALDAARLMPPPGKDFELPDARSADGDNESQTGNEGQTADGVTNKDVQEMRETLNELFESLDGNVGDSGERLRLDRDIIEIE